MIDRAQREHLQWWAERSSRYARGTALDMKQRVIRLVAYTDALELQLSGDRRQRWARLFVCAAIVTAILVTARRPLRDGGQHPPPRHVTVTRFNPPTPSTKTLPH